MLGVHLDGVSATRPDPETNSRGDAASTSPRQLLAAEREPAGDLADAFVAREQVVDPHLDVVARLVERPAPVALNCSRPDSGAFGNDTVFSDSTGIRRPSTLNE